MSIKSRILGAAISVSVLAVNVVASFPALA